MKLTAVNVNETIECQNIDNKRMWGIISKYYEIYNDWHLGNLCIGTAKDFSYFCSHEFAIYDKLVTDY